MTAPRRKVIQIAMSAVGDVDGRATFLHALCNDGTIWRYVPGGSFPARWQEITPPPGAESTAAPVQPAEPRS